MNLSLVARNLGQFVLILSILMAVCSLLSLTWVYRGDADEVWAFHATKPALAADAVATTQLGVGDATFDFADVRVGVEEDPSRGVLDVVFWHPVFRTAPEEVRGQLTFITLDSVLGEDAVERWLGGIDMATEPVVDGVDLVTLRARVDALAERDADQRDGRRERHAEARREERRRAPVRVQRGQPVLDRVVLQRQARGQKGRVSGRGSWSCYYYRSLLGAKAARLRRTDA